MALANCGFSDDANASGATYLAQFGPTIYIEIGFDPLYGPMSPVWSPPEREPNVPALIDTGASVSCIDDRLAKKLNLPLVDVQKFGGIGGGADLCMYAGQIHFPSLDIVQVGLFAGVHLEDGGQHHRALIGRSLLALGTMTYDGKTGRVILET